MTRNAAILAAAIGSWVAFQTYQRADGIVTSDVAIRMAANVLGAFIAVALIGWVMRKLRRVGR